MHSAVRALQAEAAISQLNGTSFAAKMTSAASGGTHRCRVVLKLLAAIMRVVLHRVGAGTAVDALLVPAWLLVVVAAAAHTKL